MDLFNQGMKGPIRPAPAVPGVSVNRYSPVTNWNDDPFGPDLFEPNPQFLQKKKPPPRPPPPRVNRQTERVNKQPEEVPAKPSHFIRKPTVLSSLLSRKNKNAVPHPSVQSVPRDFTNSEPETFKLFPKCEPRNVNTGALIDLSSPPSSPTFTTRSSSDGLSVDSFGSDATTSTNHHNAMNGGSTSQAESGFEDDFDLFLHSRKPIHKDDTFEDFNAVDPFSPQPVSNKPPILKKPSMFDAPTNGRSGQPQLKGPTIIRAKPARPKPPDNSALLRSTFGGSIPATLMSLNTTTPIQKVATFGESVDDKPFCWGGESPPRERSPPMPRIPPPPPPADAEDLEPTSWPEDLETDLTSGYREEEPYAIALFDYATEHPEDLVFSTNDRITLIRRENDAWLYGRSRAGREGLFPANCVDIIVPLPGDSPAAPCIATAVALYTFEPVQERDLGFVSGDTIAVTHKINEEWYFGECNGCKGLFPVNYVQMNP